MRLYALYFAVCRSRLRKHETERGGAQHITRDIKKKKLQVCHSRLCVQVLWTLSADVINTAFLCYFAERSGAK